MSGAFFKPNIIFEAQAGLPVYAVRGLRGKRFCWIWSCFIRPYAQINKEDELPVDRPSGDV